MTAKKRVECLKNNRHWFDCETAIFEREVEEIVSLVDPRGRIERVNLRRNESVVVYYRHLQSRFEYFSKQNKKASINLEDLENFPPSGLLRHYRLKPNYEPNQKFAAVASDSAEKILNEEGLAEAIERLSHLPLKMPECVINELKKLPNEEKSELFENLIETLKSPLCKMQLVDLILRSASGDEKMLERAKVLVGEIFDDEQGTADFNLFDAILRFVWEEFGYLRETDEWSAAVKLAMTWAHADKLFNLLQPTFGNEAGFRRWFWNLPFTPCEQPLICQMCPFRTVCPSIKEN